MYTLMTIWRCWHVRNEIVHHKRPPPVEASARFLSSYICSLLSLQANPNGDHVKGKMVTVPQYERRALSHAGEVVKKRQGWDAPPAGWAALSIDGSFSEKDDTTRAGMVLRDDRGAIIYSSCRELRRCMSPLESELHACWEGISLAIQWSALPIVIQTDCSEVVKLITETREDRSAHMMMVQEIKQLLQENREFLVKHIKRAKRCQPFPSELLL